MQRTRVPNVMNGALKIGPITIWKSFSDPCVTVFRGGAYNQMTGQARHLRLPRVWTSHHLFYERKPWVGLQGLEAA